MQMTLIYSAKKITCFHTVISQRQPSPNVSSVTTDGMPTLVVFQLNKFYKLIF